MKNTIKKFYCILLAIIMIFALNLNTLAANRSYNRYCGYIGTVYTHRVQFSRWGSDTVTIVNTGKTPLYVDCHRGNGKTTVGTKKVTKAVVDPGSEITFAYSGNGPYDFTLQTRANGTTSYRLKTSSGKILK